MYLINEIFQSNFLLFNVNELLTIPNSEDVLESDKKIIFLTNCLSGEHLFDFLILHKNCEIHAYDNYFYNYALTCLKIATLIVCDEQSFREIIFYGNTQLFKQKYNQIKYVMSSLFIENSKELLEFWDIHKRYIQNLHAHSIIGVASKLFYYFVQTTVFWKKLINNMKINGKIDKDYVETYKLSLYNEISNRWITQCEFNKIIDLITNNKYASIFYYILFGTFYEIPSYYQGKNYLYLKENIHKIHLYKKVPYQIFQQDMIDYSITHKKDSIPFQLIKKPYTYEFSCCPNNGMVCISDYATDTCISHNLFEMMQVYVSFYKYKYKNYVIDYLQVYPNIKLDKSIINNYFLDYNNCLDKFFLSECSLKEKNLLLISWNDYDSFVPIIFNNFKNILVLSNDSIKLNKNFFKKTIFDIQENELFDYIICNYATNLKKYKYKLNKFISKTINLLKSNGHLMLTNMAFTENSYWSNIFYDYDIVGNDTSIVENIFKEFSKECKVICNESKNCQLSDLIPDQLIRYYFHFQKK